MPMIAEDSAKASSLVRSTGTPITRAAVSLSRTAMKLRPGALLTSRQTRKVRTSTTVSDEEVAADRAVESEARRSTSRGAEMTPDGLSLENQPNLVSAHCTKNCAASVETAR